MPNKPRTLYKLSLIFILKAFSTAAMAPPTRTPNNNKTPA